VSDGKNILISVKGVHKTFRLPHERQSSLKSTLINFRRHNKGYEKQQALKDVSFEIKEGDFFGIVGRNGSGKSTLLKLLAGIYSASRGNIEVTGKLTPFIELGVGFNPELTGRENVYLNGALLGFNRKEINHMYDDIVEFAEIKRFMDQKLKNYSSGMQVRLAFSIAIRARSDILLLDEVLAVGDAAFQQKCYDYFEELKQQKKTVVFVTHDMSAVRRFCTRAIYIKDGEIIKRDSPFEIAETYIEENMDGAQKPANEKLHDLSNANKVSTSIIKQTDDMITLEVSYESKEKDEIYVGISVIRDGVSVAEINTMRQLTLKGKGKILYSLNTSIFNEGVYYITVALFRLKNKGLIGIGKNKSQFIIKGNDPTKAAALKLEDTWKYEHDENR
jgi:ABC-2 type transport system ATP-binding protein